MLVTILTREEKYLLLDIVLKEWMFVVWICNGNCDLQSVIYGNQFVNFEHSQRLCFCYTIHQREIFLQLIKIQFSTNLFLKYIIRVNNFFLSFFLFCCLKCYHNNPKDTQKNNLDHYIRAESLWYELCEYSIVNLLNYKF